MRHLKRQLQAGKPGALTWLGAFAIVLLQLQLATHLNLEHDLAGEPGETCEVCLKLDAKGKLPAFAQPAVAIPQDRSAPRIAAVRSFATARVVTHPARAPPRA